MKSSSVTIQMKATEQYFSVVLLIILYNDGYKLYVGEISKYDHLKMKAIKHLHSRSAVEILVCKLFLISDFVAKTLKCDHSNESC